MEVLTIQFNPQQPVKTGSQSHTNVGNRAGRVAINPHDHSTHASYQIVIATLHVFALGKVLIVCCLLCVLHILSTPLPSTGVVPRPFGYRTQLIVSPAGLMLLLSHIMSLISCH